MKGMLLAAGRGERMEPLSTWIPKPALEVLGRPLAARAWDHLAAHCESIVANLHRHADAVAAALRPLALAGPPLRFSPEAFLLGGAGGVAGARALLGDDDVLVANADVWVDLDLAPLLAAADSATLVLGLLPHPDPRSWSSVQLAADGRVEAFLPRHGGDTGGLLFTGFQILGRRVLAGLPAPPADFATVWEQLRRTGALRGAVVSGSWAEAGTPDAYRRLVVALVGEGWWGHPRATVAPSARLWRCAVGDACSVGADAHLEHTVVTAGGAVGPGCTLRSCLVAGPVAVPPATELERCLVLAHGIFPLSKDRRD